MISSGIRWTAFISRIRYQPEGRRLVVKVLLSPELVIPGEAAGVPFVRAPNETVFKPVGTAETTPLDDCYR
jgi:hypothetical protein